MYAYPLLEEVWTVLQLLHSCDLLWFYEPIFRGLKVLDEMAGGLEAHPFILEPFSSSFGLFYLAFPDAKNWVW